MHPKDLELLQQEPISRRRMDLLWVDAAGLDVLERAIGRNHFSVRFRESDGDPVQYDAAEIEWARRAHTIAARAAAASAREDYAEAIRHYREALVDAPGCDLYLMSIGCCYANMGHPHDGVPYLERAHAISPDNERIQRNLRMIRSAAG